jgi:methylenetetrahydrofolate dehydrogenase (NADP+)/methenyltetrahydrofolate cyclohydrolase
MSAKILDGKRLAAERIEWVRSRVEQRVADGLPVPGLAMVLVGDDQASHVYVRNKRLACERAGIKSYDHDLPSATTQSQLIELVQKLNAEPKVHGILVQLPLPEHIDQNVVTNCISPQKDVDGFHAENVGRLALRQPGLRPCTPLGIMTILRDAGVDPKGKHCVVVGASNHVGRPMVLELLLRGATVTCCHKFTIGLEHHVRQAEVLVVAVGKPDIIDGTWVADGAVVIDVGINRDDQGRLCGDVDFDRAAARASMITPVPGGVGPMTVASLLENTLTAAEIGDGRSSVVE